MTSMKNVDVENLRISAVAIRIVTEVRSYEFDFKPV